MKFEKLTEQQEIEVLAQWRNIRPKGENLQPTPPWPLDKNFEKFYAELSRIVKINIAFEKTPLGHLRKWEEENHFNYSVSAAQMIGWRPYQLRSVFDREIEVHVLAANDAGKYRCFSIFDPVILQALKDRYSIVSELRDGRWISISTRRFRGCLGAGDLECEAVCRLIWNGKR